MKSSPQNIYCTFLLSIGLLLIHSCTPVEDEQENPLVTVTWTGRIYDEISNQPFARHEVELRESHKSDPFNSNSIVYGDIIDITQTDDAGYFSFTYTDPVNSKFFTVHAKHPDYFDGIALNQTTPPEEQVSFDVLMLPKSWLRIRVLDIPEQNKFTRMMFYNLNKRAPDFPEQYFTPSTISIQPSNGDTTFLAFKPGGRLTSFLYSNSDSCANVKYENTLVPFDTIDLQFTY